MHSVSAHHERMKQESRIGMSEKRWCEDYVCHGLFRCVEQWGKWESRKALSGNLLWCDDYSGTVSKRTVCARTTRNLCGKIWSHFHSTATFLLHSRCCSCYGKGHCLDIAICPSSIMSYLTCLEDAGTLSKEKMERSFFELVGDGSASSRYPFPVQHDLFIDLRKMLALYEI